MRLICEESQADSPDHASCQAWHGSRAQATLHGVCGCIIQCQGVAEQPDCAQLLRMHAVKHARMYACGLPRRMVWPRGGSRGTFSLMILQEPCAGRPSQLWRLPCWMRVLALRSWLALCALVPASLTYLPALGPV